MLATYNYEAFGSIVGSTGSSGNAYKYDGAWRYRDDGDFGLLHVGARYYEPGVGRWISADMIRGIAERPLTLNRYSYVVNDPTDVTDPDGLQGRRRKYSDVTIGVGIGTAGTGASLAVLGAGMLITGQPWGLPVVVVGGGMTVAGGLTIALGGILKGLGL